MRWTVVHVGAGECKADTCRSSGFGGRSVQDLLRGPGGKVVQGDALSLQPLLTGVQQVVILLQENTFVPSAREATTHRPMK